MMYTRHGPDLKVMTAAERDIVLTDDDVLTKSYRQLEMCAQRLSPDERRVSKAAILRGRRDVLKIRAERAKRNQQIETTARERLLSALAKCVEIDIFCNLLNTIPAGGISVTVDIGEPGVMTTRQRVFGERDRYGYRHRQTHCCYAVTLGRGRTSVLNAAGLNLSSHPLSADGVIDGRLILGATIVCRADPLTVVCCVTARVHNRYDLQLDNETRRGRIGPRPSYLAVWRCGQESEEHWHDTLKAACETLPTERTRNAILNAELRLTDEELNMIAEVGL